MNAISVYFVNESVVWHDVKCFRGIVLFIIITIGVMATFALSNTKAFSSGQ